MPHVLVIEDDPQVRRGLLEALAANDYATSSAATGLTGLQAAVDAPPDLIVLDLGLPDIRGAELLRMLRAVSQTPVIVATAHDEEREMVAVLDAGADDYLVKPFGGAQLVARVRAVLRRRQPAGGGRRPRIEVGALSIDPAARTARLNGTALRLAPKEFDLLRYLAERPGEVVTKRTLLAEVWRLPYSQADKTVDVHVSWLRRKLGESAQQPRYLHTVRGVGLRLDVPDS